MRLLLTAQRLKRLQLDRERQTTRWVNFDARVQSAPDSPERGFELALYYAVTRDEKRGREAIEWALTRDCEPRQFALILDWCGGLMSAEERRRLESGGCTLTAASGKSALQSLQDGGFRNARALYAACEYLMTIKATQQVDLRQSAPQFFSHLPIEFLLSLRPGQIDHPDWMTHAAALTLIAVDPNLEASQYLQGWAIEDRQMIREGPGVAYEFLWADPYLPGVGYQNLDPWIYDTGGRLYARANWESQSCWIAISRSGIEQENCPSGWRDRPTAFGHLNLLPMLERCEEAPQIESRDATIVWRLKPNALVSYRVRKQQHSARADDAGILRLPAGVDGKVCIAR